MKKILAAMTSLVLCACPLYGAVHNSVITAYAAEAVRSYSSLSEFAGDGGIYSLPAETVSAADSKSYLFGKTLEGAETFYMDAKEADGSFEMGMAISEDGVYIRLITAESTEDTPADTTIIIKDNKMYMLDNIAKAGYITAGGGIEEEIGAEGIMEQFAGLNTEVDTDAEIRSCTVNIGGKDYTFEYDSEDGGILYDGDKIYAIIAGSNENEFDLLVVNELGSEIPDGIFDIPADYQMSDLDIALYGESAPAVDSSVPPADEEVSSVSPATGNPPVAPAVITGLLALAAAAAVSFKRTEK